MAQTTPNILDMKKIAATARTDEAMVKRVLAGQTVHTSVFHRVTKALGRGAAVPAQPKRPKRREPR
jgi:hypothetical protein